MWEAPVSTPAPLKEKEEKGGKKFMLFRPASCWNSFFGFFVCFQM
jgi:hypothetical protein